MFSSDRLKDVHVLVVGDVMLDQYWFGAVDRISPEAPVPVVAIERDECRAGGAANVALNIASLGSRCTLIGITGSDEAGKTLHKITDEAGVSARLVSTASAKTITKLRIVAQNQQLLRADFDNAPNRDDVERVFQAFTSAIDEADVVILSDYGKGTLFNVKDLIKLANLKNKKVIVDPKGRDFEKYRGVDTITPNMKEFEAVVGEVTDDEALRKKAKELIEKIDIKSLLVTRSQDGMILIEDEEQWVDYPSNAKEVFDVSGAGDTVIASYAIGVALGLPNEGSLRFANAAAGVVVGKLGTATTTFDEVKPYL